VISHTHTHIRTLTHTHTHTHRHTHTHTHTHCFKMGDTVETAMLAQGPGHCAEKESFRRSFGAVCRFGKSLRMAFVFGPLHRTSRAVISTGRSKEIKGAVRRTTVEG